MGGTQRSTNCRRRKPPRLTVRSKIWIEADGEMLFSRGRVELFRSIQRQGSINRAASELGLSYRKAWGHIKAMERRLGVPLVRTRVGGAEGGGARLTDEAVQILRRYAALEEGVEGMLNSRFRRVFGRFFLETVMR